MERERDGDGSPAPFGRLSGPGLTPTPIGRGPAAARDRAEPGDAGPPAETTAIQPTRRRVGGEVVGEREAAAAEARRREVSTAPSILLAAPGFLLLMAALATGQDPNALRAILLTGLVCLGAGACFAILASKAVSQPGRILWTIGILAAATLFLRTVVYVV